MEKCKTKALQEDLGILMHIPNAGIFTTSSEPSYIQNFRIFITLYIHNPSMFRTRGIFRTLSKSTVECFAKIVNGYNYFQIL